MRRGRIARSVRVLTPKLALKPKSSHRRGRIKQFFRDDGCFVGSLNVTDKRQVTSLYINLQQKLIVLPHFSFSLNPFCFLNKVFLFFKLVLVNFI